MEHHDHNLNIHYTAPDDIWAKIGEVYASMPYWVGYNRDCIYWRGNDGSYVAASVEPSGLQFFGEMPQEDWEPWFTLLKQRLTGALGYEIGKPEDGYEFRYYD